MPLKVDSILRDVGARTDAMAEPFDTVTLAHDERHLRRKVLTLAGGEKVMLDLAEAIALHDGDRLLLEDGRMARVIAAEEDLYAVGARNGLHLTELAWHLGNRHLPAQIEDNRILIQRDHAIKAMVEGLGGTVEPVRERFTPARGTYSGHSHGHGHGDQRGDQEGAQGHDDRHHGERDRDGHESHRHTH